MPVEVYWITPADLLAAFGVHVVLIVVAVFAVVWVCRPRSTGAPDVDPDATVEIRRPASTGTICDPAVTVPADDRTEVIRVGAS